MRIATKLHMFEPTAAVSGANSIDPTLFSFGLEAPTQVPVRPFSNPITSSHDPRPHDIARDGNLNKLQDQQRACRCNLAAPFSKSPTSVPFPDVRTRTIQSIFEKGNPRRETTMYMISRQFVRFITITRAGETQKSTVG